MGSPEDLSTPKISDGRKVLHLRAERAFGLEALNVRLSVRSNSYRQGASGVSQPLPHPSIGRTPGTMQTTARGVALTPQGDAARPATVLAGSAGPMSSPGLAGGTSRETFSMPVLLEHDRTPFPDPMLSLEQKLSVLQELDASQVKTCRKCNLCQTRTNTVFGEGDAGASLMFIGEGPGGEEDASGRPFVGRAGQLLEKMIVAMGLDRSKVYIANMVKCRAYHTDPAPKDRPPTSEEVAACWPYLQKQIEIIRPRVIVTLGLPASQFILSSKLAMGKMRGKWADFRGIKVMPTYHPSYVLRNYTDETRAMVWSDLQQVMTELGLRR